MKLFRSFAVVAALGSSVLAVPAWADQPKETKKEPEKKEVDAANVTKWLAFFDQVVDVVVANKDTCDKMATDLDGLFTRNVDLIKIANEAKAKGMKLPKDAQDHMMTGIKKMGPAMQACMKNEKVKAAFARFDGKDAKKK
ncbi:MAG: hypothetical protein NT062_00395 [Proteobacteria bacterium]|nr:hypothetical protein [Pseudomonadota bacterium]